MNRTIQVHLGEPAQAVDTLHFDSAGQRERSAFADAFEHTERRAARTKT